FGLVVRRLRLEKRISQEALAVQAGIERAYMGRIERGETMPTLTLILKVARGLGLSAGIILTETELLLESGKF
ncbi:MAG: helix-turn-helix domain-containing protein, partial [Saezia sp.]